MRPYFQSHTIVVLTDQPLGKVLQSPDASGRLVNWSVELGEFDIKYKPCTAIKAQALSDFVIECIIPDDTPQLILSEVSDPWLLYVDSSYKCLSPKEADYALQEVHEGICRQHLGGRNLAHKILRQGYYWPGMQKDAIKFAKQCLSIGLRFTSITHPQSNGQTENMNCSILQGLKRKLDDAKGAWADELPKFAEAENEENGGTLDLLDDVRAQALDRMISTKQRVARYYNRRVRMKIFRVGDLVLRKLEVSNPKAAVGKLSPNWEGLYKVLKVLRPGAYSLETLSGEAIPRTWNAENLRQYYQ
ncbi:hypothetical protein RJ639_046871 [Escallonia herrerae]|uniref:Integrase zinc-binding domain-containing protein n=1 Tax=Escallonia herrerae TaxID=1293975 RepID=A0AA89AZE1_9ASTE|nr:hypothetical protein RJ639_046871 [Escallonia herrerae]